jgi:hypothetical protein
MNKRPSLINTVANIWIPQKAKNVGTGSFLLASENGFFRSVVFPGTAKKTCALLQETVPLR